MSELWDVYTIDRKLTGKTCIRGEQDIYLLGETSAITEFQGKVIAVYHTGGNNMEKIIAACGNDCSACPRYIAHPYEKTDEELRHTAELWLKIGYRDHLVSNEEISCMGCKPENWCRYNVVKCCEGKGINNCSECKEYPCQNMKECFEVTKSFEPMCKKICTEEEYLQMKKAFFEKEQNLNSYGEYQKG